MVSLSQREREVIALVATGLTNEEIAARLFLGAATIKTHLRIVMGKTGTRNRVELVLWAIRNRLVEVV